MGCTSTSNPPLTTEEVKLHWANADHYYIKTAENFTRHAFKTEKGRVRFELTSATTERDNVKESADNERRFILAEQPLKLDGNELVICFEYRHDEKKRKQKELNAQANEALLALPEGAPLTQEIGQWMSWRAALASALPTVWPYTAKAAQHYGAIRSTLEKAGRPIGVNDLHIAAHARSEGLTLVTSNMAEFERVPGLLLENWVGAPN